MLAPLQALRMGVCYCQTGSVKTGYHRHCKSVAVKTCACKFVYCQTGSVKTGYYRHRKSVAMKTCACKSVIMKTCARKPGMVAKLQNNWHHKREHVATAMRKSKCLSALDQQWGFCHRPLLSMQREGNPFPWGKDISVMSTVPVWTWQMKSTVCPHIRQ